MMSARQLSCHVPALSMASRCHPHMGERNINKELDWDEVVKYNLQMLSLTELNDK